MTINAVFILVLMFATGGALGAFYFVGLWQTLRRLPQAGNRASLLIVSFILRMGIVLAILYLLMDGHWERIAAAMAGFVLMRKILTYRLGPQKMAEAVQK